MKAILYIILIIFGACIFIMFLPIIVGGFFAYINYQDGNYGWTFLSAILGLVCQWGFFALLSGGEIGGIEDCPYCGGGDTDGNHCHTCDGDF